MTLKLWVDPRQLREARIGAFKTQAQLARDARVGESTIERIERGGEDGTDGLVAVRYTTLASIAKALKVDLETLMDHVESM